MTNEQKRDLALKGKDVLVHLQRALVGIHEIEVLMVEKAAVEMISDAASMVHRELMLRCKP